MRDRLEAYRRATSPLPEKALAWQLHAAGLENLGRGGQPDLIPLPRPGPDELLARIDAVGLCFSDIKLITQGPEHPRIAGRDLGREPVIPGHEVSLTIVAVGESQRGRFEVGDRFVVQADAYYQGVSIAYGYALAGALTQFGLLGKEILDGDEGCYLLPVRPDTGYSEAALAEPWACVEASYRITPRRRLKPGGVAWFLGAGRSDGFRLSLADSERPRRAVLTDAPATVRAHLEQALPAVRRDGFNSLDLGRLREELTDGAGFDDIVVFGAEAAAIERAASLLGRGGVFNIVRGGEARGAVSLDVGRIHYDDHFYVGTEGFAADDSYRSVRPSSELADNGKAWFIGAGGPMGQMHVQRALELPEGPRTVLISDVDSARLGFVEERFASTARARGRSLLALNPAGMTAAGFGEALARASGGAGFEDVVLLAPAPALAEEASRHLADGGSLNIFAGLSRGTRASFPLADICRRKIQIVGSSGSAISDLAFTLGKAEARQLSTNYAVAAIGGMRAAREGLEGVKAGAYPGKVVIYPQIPDLPLLPLTELAHRLPDVAEKLDQGRFWSREAEQALLEEALLG
jgi:threonine dehydrogenase-like Zn-dependent dehydrogenase